jgi:hypothetical protein
MSALLRAELLKLSTTRTFAALVGAAAALSLLIMVLVTTLSDSFDEDDLRALLTFDTTSFFISLLGAIGITGEWRHRTITSSLLAGPDRVRFLVAKVLAYAAAGALLSVIVTLLIAAVGAAILASRDLESFTVDIVADVLWRNAVVAALLGGVGVGIGSVVRNQVGAVVLLLGLGFMIEPTVLALAPDVGAYLPLSGAPSGINLAETGIEDESDLLGTGAAILVELAWIAGLTGIGAWLLRSRDL